MAAAAALAVSAAPTQTATVARMLRWPVQRTGLAADELADRRVATRSGTALRIAHDFVKAAILAELPAERSEQMHARLADELEQTDGADVRVLRRALVHRRAAGQLDAGLALRVLEASDRRLLGASDLRELGGIADAQAREDPRLAHELLTQVARVASEIGRPDLALEEWVALSLRAGTTQQRAYAALHASISALECGDRSRAESLLAECHVAGDPDPALEIQRAAHESELRATSSSASEAPMRHAALLARDLAVRGGGFAALRGEDRRAYLAALQAEYFFALRTEQPTTMLALAEEIAAKSDTTEDRLRGTLHRVLPLRLLGQYREAERTCQAVRLVAVREQLPAMTFLSGYLLARCLHSLGRLVPARAAAQDVAALADRAPVVVPSWLSAAWIRSLVHEVDASLVGWRATGPHLERLIAVEPDPHFRMQIHLTAAQWSARLGGRSSEGLSVACAQTALQDARRAGCDRCAAEASLRTAEVFARLGQPDTASSLLADWDEGHQDPVGQYQLWRAHVEGLVVAHRDPVAAAAVLRSAHAVAETQEAELERVWVDLDLGRVLAPVDRDGCVEVLRGAATSAHEMQAAGEEQRALQLLRSVGVRTWRRGRAAAGAQDGLTERERSIAQLVCQGASNPEIAETLFLSRKTIERHVSNVFAKTGVRNRAELVARISTGAEPT